MSERGSALVVVLWALVALSALSLVASLGAVVDLRLAVRHREHASALAAAESGLAEALVAVALSPSLALTVDSLAGGEGGAAWSTRWAPAGTGLRIRSIGIAGSARREIEAWTATAAGVEIRAWRELR